MTKNILKDREFKAIIFILIIVGFVFFIGIKNNVIYMIDNSGITNGFYKFKNTKEYKTNDLIVLCISDEKWLNLAKNRGYIKKHSFYCKNGGLIGKRIVGVFNDEVTLTQDGVFINSKLLEKSKILANDMNGLDLKKINGFEKYKLKKDEFFVMSAKPTEMGFDSRYFGKIQKDNILGIIEKF